MFFRLSLIALVGTAALFPGCSEPDPALTRGALQPLPAPAPVLADRQPPAPSPDEAAVLAVAEAALDAITREDMVAFTDLMFEEAVIAPTDPEGFALSTRAAERARTLPGDIVERGFDAEVRISGRIATVWLPYDLYIDGEWSHCGVDALSLVKDGEEWRILAMTWSRLQPPACSEHPEGPPAVGPDGRGALR
jgi:hypothetical protein